MLPFDFTSSQVRRNIRILVLLPIILVVALITLFTPYIFDGLFSPYRPMQEFRYPQEIDLDKIISHVRTGRPLPSSMEKIRPSNPRVFRFQISDLTLCQRRRIQLLVLVKTTHEAFATRDAIRHTWGNHSCYPHRRTKVLFLLGIQRDPHLEKRVKMESKMYGDILQQNFYDNYYNNTLKMMMGFEYFTQFCQMADFLVLIDHDYLLNPSNLMRFINSVHPRLYSRFLAGYVWYAPAPMRMFGSKWRLSHDDYPFSLYPNYAEAGTLIISADFAKDLYIAMQFTKYHKFDDIFLGIILHKLHIAPVHSQQVLHLRPKRIPTSFISIHGFDSPNDLRNVWVKSGLVYQCDWKRKSKRGIGR